MSTTKTWTINDIKTAVRATGSHWFDPDSMRFFGCRLQPTVCHGPGGIYFVSSEKPPHEPRGYTVRKFYPATSDIHIASDLCEFKTAKRAKAKALAAGSLIGFTNTASESEGGVPYALGGVSEVTQAYQPVTILEQFTDDLARHGNAATANAGNAGQLILLARKHHLRMEADCNRGNQHDSDGEPKRGLRDLREHIVLVARHVGATGVIFSGDPRGCTVKLTFPDGFVNDFGREGYCVPTEF